MSGLVGWWPLHEQAGSTAVDLAGSNDGSISGVTLGGTVGPGGLPAMTFDGAGGTNVDLGTTSLGLGNDDPVTLAAWVRRRGDGHILCISNEFLTLNVGATNVAGGEFGVRSYDGSNQYGVSSGVTATDEWTHFVGSYNGTTWTLYVNGEAVTTGTAPYRTGNGRDAIGGDSTHNEAGFAGDISDVRVYARPLSPLEIRTLYRESAPLGHLSERPSGDVVSSGLVSRYSMDAEDVAGSTLVDSAGSNDGTISGASVVEAEPGLAGEALSFDGTDDKADVALSPSVLELPVSVSFWMNWTGQSPDTYSPRPFFIDDSDLSVRFGVQLNGTGTDQAVANYHDGTNHQAYFTAPATGWQHIVCTADSGGVSVYTDGYRQGVSGSIAGGVVDGPTLTIADDSDGANSYPGELSEVRVYDRVLSPSEIRALYWDGASRRRHEATTASEAVRSGGVARYSMDDADVEGSTLADSWGSNDATISGATTGVPGVGRSEAFSFDGTDDEVTGIADFSHLSSTAPKSVSVWVQPVGNTSARQAIIRMANGLGLKLRDGVYKVRTDDAGSTGASIATSSHQPVAGEWAHLVGIWNDGVLYLYVNGVLAAEDGRTTDTGGMTGNYIGRHPSGSYRLHGAVDEVRLYDRALSPLEVWSLYSIGRSQTEAILDA